MDEGSAECRIAAEGKEIAGRTAPAPRRREPRGRRASGCARRVPWQLSGGMQQRVAIARAIAYEPEVLLMDEPFASVDAQTRAELEDLVRSLWARLGVTIVFVTHDIDESVYLGERVIVLSASPTVVMEDVPIDLGVDRNELVTRADPRFGQLRGRIYALIKDAKGRAEDGGVPQAGAKA